MGIFSIDIIVFSTITLVYVKLKKFRPEWFFPLSGLTFFLPPEEADLKELRQDRELSQKKMNSFQKKKFSKKPTLPLKMMQANSVHMQALAYSSELDLTIMFFVILTCHLLITQALKYLIGVRIDSNFAFYLSMILLFMIVSNVFKMITINGMQYSIHKIYVYCALFYVLALFVLFFGFREFLFFSFDREFQRLNSHLAAILSQIFEHNPLKLNFEAFLLISILFSGLFVFILLPSIARFGENYVKTIGQYYALEEKEKKPVAASKNQENPEQSQENLQKQRRKSEQQEKIRWVLKLFNMRLILNLLVLFFWVKPMMMPWVSFLGSEEAIVLMRLLFSLTYCLLIAYSYKYELELHFNKIYETLKTLLVDPGNDNFTKVQIRVSNLVQTSLMVSYIIVSKVIVPLIFLYITVYKMNFGGLKIPNNLLPFREYQRFLHNPMLKLGPMQRNDVILHAADFNCMGTFRFQEIGFLTSHCALHQRLEVGKVWLGFAGFRTNEQEQGDFLKMMKELLRKVNAYGLIPEEFYLNVFSFWLFNYFLANYFLTVFYIIFLRHSSNV